MEVIFTSRFKTVILLSSLIMFLKINHYQCIMGIEEEQDFVVDVVNHKYDFKAISRIIQENIKALYEVSFMEQNLFFIDGW
ncbi:hypothetical protein [Peribacillus butanolivorans]|uniref:hypothetical protein n=1 Tax=Peribacillus butanolivorans TaxID=421767 RepID=UPI00382770D8